MNTESSFAEEWKKTEEQKAFTDAPEEALEAKINKQQRKEEALSEKRVSSDALKEAFANVVDAVDEAVSAGTKKRVKKETKTFFFRNNRRMLKWTMICGTGVAIQILKHRNKTLAGKVELLEIENHFLHFVISGLSNPSVDETEFSKEIARRANYPQLVGEL